jgi:high affinity cGMP-specific 3',5'-cyclic phosphodiesterase 9
MTSISPSISRVTPELVSSYVHIPDNINTFDFDTCLINECFILKNIAGYIFRQVVTDVCFDLDESCLAIFIKTVCENYNKNHFHNFQHAVNVLQMTFLLLKETGLIYKLKSHVIIATLIAALTHDVDHPGNTNSFEINSMSKYAKLYNDNSVLENHHCTLTFELIEETGLIKWFKDTNFREIRKTIIECILGTDMSRHCEHLNKFEKINFANETFTNEEQIIISSSIIHFADLSNSIKKFDICLEWSKRISLEFYEQTLKEEMEGLPSLSFMKVHDNLSMCLNEINFITNITIPTWKLFVSKFENMSFIIDNINATLNKWKEIEKHYVCDNDINILNY